MTTYLEFIEKVESNIRISNNTEIRNRIKDIINETIEEFVDYREWINLQSSFEFTTGKLFTITVFDDSDPYIITISGNNAFKFKAGDTVTIADSVSNDGDYTVVSAVNSGSNTLVTVSEALADTDVTGSPALSSEHEDYACPSDFFSEIGLYDSSGVRVEKVSYKEFVQSSISKWANLKNRINLSGEDATYTFLYYSKGDTLSLDDDTSIVIDYYEFILKRWVTFNFWIWYGADESAAKTEVLLKTDLRLLSAKESRMAKNGRDFKVGTFNR